MDILGINKLLIVLALGILHWDLVIVDTVYSRLLIFRLGLAYLSLLIISYILYLHTLPIWVFPFGVLLNYHRLHEKLYQVLADYTPWQVNFHSHLAYIPAP